MWSCFLCSNFLLPSELAVDKFVTIVAMDLFIVVVMEGIDGINLWLKFFIKLLAGSVNTWSVSYCNCKHVVLLVCKL